MALRYLGATTRDVVELRFDGGRTGDDGLSAAAGRLGLRHEVLADQTVVYTDAGDVTAAALLDHGVEARGTLIRRCGLEDVSLALTGRSLNE